MLDSKIKFLNEASESLSKIYDALNEKKTMKISEFTSNDTALIIIDMVNGFVKSGNLSSERIYKINGSVAELCKKFKDRDIESIAFADTHTNDSVEFLSYPVHCLETDDESKITDEISNVGDLKVFAKNSTNGCLVEEFQEWLREHSQIKNFIIVGCCTDICIQQFAITLKTYFNEKDLQSKIIVPSNLVATYDGDNHNGDLMQLMALYQMSLNGVEIVAEIR